jgi:hypothetical protein
MLHLSALGLSSGRLGTLFLVACSLATHLSNCQTQQPKTPDTTPPTIRWHVVNKATNVSHDIQGSGDVAAKLGDSYTVTCFVQDPEGVHEITLGGGGSYTCTSGGLGQNSSFLQKTDTQTLNPDSNGNVLNQIFLIRDADFNFQCNSGFGFSSGSLSLNGTGQNYNGGNVKGGLEFHVAP